MRKHKIFLFLLTSFICIGSSNSFAQKKDSKKKYSTGSNAAIKHYEEAGALYRERSLLEAANEAAKAIRTDTMFIEAYLLLGQIYNDSKQPEDAIFTFERVVSLSPDYFPNVYYSLGVLQLDIGDYKKAQLNFKKLLTYSSASSGMLKNTKSYLSSCEFAIAAMENPVPYNPVSLGENINTLEGEYSPAITADESTLYYTKLFKPEGSSRLSEDVFVSKKISATWSKGEGVGAAINTMRNEAAVCISPDGQTLYFVSDREGGYGRNDIYEVKKNGDGFEPARNLGNIVNSNYFDSQPSISSDGKTLYFVSNRPGGIGEMDIWKTSKNQFGNWNPPVNLGPAINTTQDEESPFIHPDNQTMYFSSNGYLGMGKKDLFYSRKDAKGAWTPPVNMGYPINGPGNDRNIIVNAKGDFAFISSDHIGKEKHFDLFQFELHQKARPIRVSYLKGKVFDANTKKPIEAKFELIDLESKETIIESFSNKGNGEFLVCLPVDKNYALNVSAANYLFYSDNFSFSDEKISNQSYFLKDVPLKPIQKGESVVLKNIFFDTNSFALLDNSKVELGKLLSFLNQNPNLKIEIGGHTDNQGNVQSNQILSEARAKAVKEFLVAANVMENRIQYKGYGEQKPIMSNDSEEGRSQNRRTEFKILE